MRRSKGSAIACLNRSRPAIACSGAVTPTCASNRSRRWISPQLRSRFGVILLSDVPCLSAEQREGRIARGTEDGVERVEDGDRESPQLSIHDDGVVQRFIALVDECYDRKVPLCLSALVPMDELYTEGYLQFPFRRTLSRLQEMQMQRFGQQA